MDDPNLLEAPNFVNFEEAGSINGAMMRFQAKHPVLETIAERLGKFSIHFMHGVDFCKN
jgi:hypothetical protein